jgi:hypothetical protein
MKRRRALLVGLALVLGCSRNEVGSGNVTSVERDVGPFAELQIVGGFDVVIRLGAPKHVIAFTIDDNLATRVTAENNGRRLVATLDRDAKPTARPQLRVDAPDLVLVRCDGDPNVTLHSVRNARLQLDLKEAGSIRANGSTQKLKVFIDGRGQARLEDLRIEEALVHVSGAGQAHIARPTHLEAELHGSARVTYEGTPTIESVVRDSGVLEPRPPR